MCPSLQSYKMNECHIFYTPMEPCVKGLVVCLRLLSIIPALGGALILNVSLDPSFHHIIISHTQWLTVVYL